MLGIRQCCRLRKTRTYYGILLCLATLCLLVASLIIHTRGVVQFSPALNRATHLSPLFVAHEPDGGHHHTLLGDLAFGDDLGYMRCAKDEFIVDGIYHAKGEHVTDLKRYGGSYIGGDCGTRENELGLVLLAGDGIVAEPNVYRLRISAETGEVRFVSVEGVSSQLKQTLLNTVYASPEEAEFAATGVETQEAGEITVQHAVGICTHADNVITYGTGTRRHVTDFRKHENGRHYTVTRHQKYVSGAGWFTVERFYYSVRRSYCGC